MESECKNKKAFVIYMWKGHRVKFKFITNLNYTRKKKQNKKKNETSVSRDRRVGGMVSVPRTI